MGIGRREFLKLFGAGITALSASPSSAIAILDDHYVNRKLGIAFRKPRGWKFSDVKEMGEVKAGQILDIDDPNLSREIIDSVELPILAISKDYPSPNTKRFTPGVMIYLDRFESLEAYSGKSDDQLDPHEGAYVDIDFCETILKDFRVTSPPKSVRVSECEAEEYTAAFLFEHEIIDKPTRVRMRTVAIFQRPACYTVRMYDAPDESPDMAFDYTSFVKSVRMV